MDEEIESIDYSKFSLSANSVDNSVWEYENVNNKYQNNKCKSVNNKYNQRPNSLSISWNTESFETHTSPALNRWFRAVSKICRHDHLYDDIYPWQNFPLDSIKSEKATRYRYSAIKKKWVKDKIFIKLENLPFDHGAMRECFRLKKLSHGVTNNNWSYSSNYVAKRYIKECKRDMYFEDVKLQMEAKLWAEEYNRQNPPKKVDIFQLSVIELGERENHPLYHIEHFMEGNYRKYNSNSGFVDDSCIRNTPQAFSHFTFERSGHRMMVVDIQGVGDLYTDPQIHTADGQSYGDGNLGLRGMALFFSSHRCNAICQFLILSQFDMHQSELEFPHNCLECAAINMDDDGLVNGETCPVLSPLQPEYVVSEKDFSYSSANSALESYKPRQRSISFKMPGTVVKDERRTPSISDSPPAFLDELFPVPIDLIRTLSVDSGVLSASNPPFISSQGNIAIGNDSDGEESLDCSMSIASGQKININNIITSNSITNNHVNSTSNGNGIYSTSHLLHGQLPASNINLSFKRFRRRQRNYSDGSDIDAVLMSHDEHVSLYHSMRENHKPSSADHPTNLDQEIGHSILAQVHHEMARLHECGRIARLYKRDPGRILHQHFWSNLIHADNSGDCEAELVHNGSSNKNYENTDYNDNLLISNNNDRDRLTVNWQACLYHERHAAQLGCLEAVIVMARYSLTMNGHMLQDCPLQPTDMDRDCGLDYLWRAADSGDRRSMIELANKYQSSNSGLLPVNIISNKLIQPDEVNKNKSMTTDWAEAVRWYKRAFEAINKSEGQIDAKDAEGKYDSADDLLSPQQILASMAALYMTGGFGLVKDCTLAGELYSQAAEIATNAMQGRQAAKYYELADSAYSMIDE